MLSTKRRYTKPKHARQSHREWLHHIENCRRKKVTPKEYCATHGLSVKVFKHHDWLERRKQKQTPVNFAEVNVVSEPTLQVAHYEIVYPKGVSLRVSSSEALPSLLKSLEVYL